MAVPVYGMPQATRMEQGGGCSLRARGGLRMKPDVQEYLSKIGKKGGMMSRRVITSEQQTKMQQARMMDIYALVDQRNGDIFYIGKALNAEKRKHTHFNRARRMSGSNMVLNQRIRDIESSKVGLCEVRVLKRVPVPVAGRIEVETIQAYLGKGAPLTNQLGRLGKGKPKTLTKAERKRRAERLAEARKKRWPA